MGDAIRIEQRLHDLIASWRRRQGPNPGDRSAREMEQQAVERLFARHRNQEPAYAHDVEAAREMERQAIERLYGGRSTVVVEPKHEVGNEDS